MTNSEFCLMNSNDTPISSNNTVNTYGSVRLPPRPSFFSDSSIFEVPDWHFKDSISSVVS